MNAKKNNNKTEKPKKKVNGKLFSSEYQPPEKWNEERALQLGNDLINWLKEKDSEGNDEG